MAVLVLSIKILLLLLGSLVALTFVFTVISIILMTEEELDKNISGIWFIMFVLSVLVNASLITYLFLM